YFFIHLSNHPLLSIVLYHLYSLQFTKILLFREHFSPKCAIHCICIENSTDSGENYLSKHASPTNLRNDGIPHGYPKKPPTVFGGILSGLRLFLTLHDGADKCLKLRLRICRPRFKFGVELTSDKPWMSCKFNRFHQPAIRA